MLPFALAVLQLIVSAGAGFVGMVDGDATVRQYEHVPIGTVIQTGAFSHVELSLGWNAFLRLDERTTALLESADRTSVAVRIESGSGLVEVAAIEKASRIVVTTGTLRTVIDFKGVFRFEQNAVSVLNGKLTISDNSTHVAAGWHVKKNGSTYETKKIAADVGPELKRFMNGPKAGFINAVVGEANVHLHEQPSTVKPIETGLSGHVELLLAPGSFLRLDQNSSVVVESNFLKDTIVRVLSGTALLESDVVDPQLRMHVALGSRKARIGSAGLYRFTRDTADVIDGTLPVELGVGGMEYRIIKGRRILEEGGLEGNILPKASPDELDRWSARRSYELATANLMAHFGDARPNFFLFGGGSAVSVAWMYSPKLNGFTFIPVGRNESTYKQTFVPLQTLLPPRRALPPPTTTGDLPCFDPPFCLGPSTSPPPPDGPGTPTNSPPPSPTESAPAAGPAPDIS